jgi:hypothetical protein
MQKIAHKVETNENSANTSSVSTWLKVFFERARRNRHRQRE